MAESNNNECLLYKELIQIEVGRAEVVENKEKQEKYIVYAVTVRTNSLSFAAPHTRVYRRYNDFLWLYRRLRRIPIADNRLTVPSFPCKLLPFWNFEETFLESRRQSLEAFLQRVVQETIFLSSSSLHLFLQTELSPKAMNETIDSGSTARAINVNVKLVTVDQDFMKVMATSRASAGHHQDSAKGDPVVDGDPSSSVYWRCGKNTLKKVASLPHFNPVLKEYESLFPV